MLLLTKRIILKQKLSHCSYAFTHMKSRFYSTKADVKPNLVEIPELRLSSHKLKINQREPFVKNFFLGKYDLEFAAFPEPQTYDRHKEFFEWLKPIEEYIESNINNEVIDKDGKISSEVMNELKNLGVFQASVPDEYGGLGLNFSEYAKLVETLSRIPVLGAYFTKLNIPVNLISTFASNEHKEKYLQKIAKGECIPSLCRTEDSTGSESSAILSKVTQSDNEKYFKLYGFKTHVVDAHNANLFVVFAEYEDEGRAFTTNEVSVFLVEPSFNGIKIESPTKLLGFEGLSMSTVKFRDTMIPIGNIIENLKYDSKTFTSTYSNGKHNVGAQAIGITKRYLELFIRQLKSNKDFNAVQFKNSTVQEIIGNICCSIYNMESVLYLTTGMMDTVMNQDCNMEKCIVESYCVDTCIDCIMMGSQILGSLSRLAGSEIEKVIRDAMSLHGIYGVKDTHIANALMGVQHMGNAIFGDIKKRRNPWFYPFAILKILFTINKPEKLYIEEHLHPTLQPTAKLIEECIYQFSKSVEGTLLRRGRLITEEDLELKRISKIATFLYVMAAIVARASRSYCLGMKMAEKEIYIAQVSGYMLYEKIQNLIRELNDGEFVNGDTLIKFLSDSAFENNKYFVAHPLERNF